MLPLLKTLISGPRSRALATQLHRYESRNVTFVAKDWPVFWKRAHDSNVWDVDGNRFLDLTAGFGVASVGHNNPRVISAARRQLSQLVHGLGDVCPNELKMQLARELVELTYGRWEQNQRSTLNAQLPTSKGKSVLSKIIGAPRRGARPITNTPARVLFANSGSESVEAALKTALLATGKPGVIAFRGAYHGLTYGALGATAWKFFRDPFQKQLGKFVTHVEWPADSVTENVIIITISETLTRGDIGAVIVEPILGRGGIVLPPPNFLPALRRLCDQHGALLIADEVFTGFCRTGRWFAVEHWDVVPDLICVGKAMSNGFPISACIGRAAVMDAWPENRGEALHTSTHLGSPLGCAMALATIAEVKRLQLDERACRLCDWLPGRGLGLMKGIPLASAAVCQRVVKRLLRRGILALGGGERGDVLTLTPPLTIDEGELDFAAREIERGIKLGSRKGNGQGASRGR